MNAKNTRINHLLPTMSPSCRPRLWTTNVTLFGLLLIAQCLISLNLMADTSHYMVDDDHVANTYQSSLLPNSYTTLYEATLPNFFGEKETNETKISISIQQMNSSRESALMDEEKQQSINLFSGDPLDRKALVIEVPFE